MRILRRHRAKRIDVGEQVAEYNVELLWRAGSDKLSSEARPRTAATGAQIENAHFPTRCQRPSENWHHWPVGIALPDNELQIIQRAVANHARASRMIEQFDTVQSLLEQHAQTYPTYPIDGNVSVSIAPTASPTLPVWDDESWLPLPELDGSAHCGTCVVGLGGSGLTAIAELLDRGEDVIGIDAFDVGAGAAGRNGGFLLAGAYDFYHDAVRLHGGRQARSIYEATLREIQRIAEATPDCVSFVGSRRLAAVPAEVADCEAQLRAMRRDGLSVEWYEGDDGIGLTIPTDAACNPLVRCRTLALQALSRGARLFARTSVAHVSSKHILTRQGAIVFDRAIIAVDGKLEELVPDLRGRVRTARLQMLATAPTNERIVPCPMYYREGFEYWQQLPNGSIVLGGFRDQGGEGEWTTDTAPAAPVQDLLERFLRETLGVHAPITHRWAASAGYSSKGLPIVEAVDDGVWAIGGYSGTGNVIGALCGRAAVALALDANKAPSQLLTPG